MEHDDEPDDLGALLRDMQARSAYWNGFRYPPHAAGDLWEFAERLAKLLEGRTVALRFEGGAAGDEVAEGAFDASIEAERRRLRPQP